MTKEQEYQFEVDCFDVVNTKEVILTDVATGETFRVPAISWTWKNEFYANVEFEFKGHRFTVLAEVHPEMD